MKQLIARLDDELHARIKERAAAEGRSVNDLVIESLVAALDRGASRRAVRDRARASGRLVVPQPDQDVPPREQVLAATRGSGDAVSVALDEERFHR